MSPGGPGADEGAAGPGAASSGADTGSRVRALVVDDHPVVRDGLVAMLGADEGVEVVGSAQDGAEALRLIARTRPDVVLMDLRMPGMGGTEAIRELRRTDSRRGPTGSCSRTPAARSCCAPCTTSRRAGPCSPPPRSRCSPPRRIRAGS
jgi:hypothetical protein